MAPRNPAGSSGGPPVVTIFPKVDDAKRALDSANAQNLKTRKPENKNKETGVGLDGAARVADGVSKDDGVNLLFDGVNSLAHGLPPLVKALEAVARIHPFVEIAVGAFKVVIELEIKRRDNDKKVSLLFLEMRNMMSALLQLQTIRANHVARGISIGARLADLVERAANDIKECVNVCDTYSKQRLLVKVLKGPIWDDTLKGYVQVFTNLKEDFNFAISLHTGMAIDHANDRLDNLMARMELILKFFGRCIPRAQRTLNSVVEQAGGPDVASRRPDILRTLIECERSFEYTSSSVPGYGYGYSTPYSPPPARTSSVTAFPTGIRRQRHRGWRSYVPTTYSYGVASPAAGYVGQPSPPLSRRGSVDSTDPSREQEITLLQQELMQVPSVEIKKNMEAFERKFEIQTKELAEEIKKFVAREGDRVISSMLAGPHERIIDPDIYEIWKDMRWRGIVKARHLVLAIYDYYLQKQEDQEFAFKVDGNLPERRRNIDEDDAWTLEYIDLMHVQPIIDALDEDTSGYVTIQEVNRFTTSRPKDWSLLHWMAYWAVGWQVCITTYHGKILSTLNAMSNLLGDSRTIYPPNRDSIREYLDVTRQLVASMMQSFQLDTERLYLLPRFGVYMDQNEAQLRKHLETMKYSIDALDTVALMNGQKRLERTVFPLLYLLLSRHYDIMKLGRIYVLHVDELIDAQECTSGKPPLCD